MIDELYNKHARSAIAVIGSSRSASLYKSREDIAIAVNGASLLEAKIDYSLSGHPSAHLKSWFKQMKGAKILNSTSAAYSKDLYPEEKQRSEIQKTYESSLKTRSLVLWEEYFVYNPHFEGLPKPSHPHMFFSYYGLNESARISREQKKLHLEGTSSCQALQAAFIMGASEIHLYGCAFENNGKDYFYNTSNGEKGHINEKQMRFMDFAIEEIMKQGTNVFVHGNTNLKNAVRVG